MSLGGGWRARWVPERMGPLLAAGVLMGLAHPPFHLLIPSFVALVPFILWLERLPQGAEGRRQARRAGFFFGLVYYTLVYYWLFVALVFYTWLAVLAFVAPVVILSAFMAWMAGGVVSVRQRLGWPVCVVFPVFWTANEWLRANLPQVGFPWMQLGDTLTGFPWLIGAADLVGSRGLSLWLALANSLVALVVLRRGAARGVARPMAALVLTVAVPLAYSLWRWSALELRPVATVGVVQPNVPEHLKIGDPREAADSAVRATRTLVQGWSGRPELDLVLLPETVVPLNLDPIPSLGNPGWGAFEAWALGLGASVDADVLIGALGARDLEGGEYQLFNSAFLLRPGMGRVARYDKRYLVPIVERVPFLDPSWFSGLRFFGGFGVGVPLPPLEITGERGAARFGVMICYESIFSPLGRRYRAQGADFLVNITNDAWFGRDAWWSRSSALWQHPAHLVMRAIEARMGIARAANTGVSEIVDPLGRISHATGLFEPAAFIADVQSTEGTTVFVRTGDATGWGAALAAICALVVAARRGRRAAAGGHEVSEKHES